MGISTDSSVVRGAICTFFPKKWKNGKKKKWHTKSFAVYKAIFILLYKKEISLKILLRFITLHVGSGSTTWSKKYHYLHFFHKITEK